MFSALTGLRGAAALLVMLYHYSVFRDVFNPNYSPLGPGYLAVDLFFVLSGFLMSMNYGADFENGFSKRAYTAFLRRRFARVYPLYIVCTLLAILVNVQFYVLHKITFVTNMFLIQQFGFGAYYLPAGESIDGPGWSISTEFIAYILFPVLLSVATSKNRSLCWILLLASFVALTILYFLPQDLKVQDFAPRGPLDISSGRQVWPAMRCVADFSIGLLTWRFSRIALAERLGGNLAAILLGVSLTAFWLLRGSDLILVAIFGLLIVHLVKGSSFLKAVLSSAPIMFLGEISYAVYLLHMPTYTEVRGLEERLAGPQVPHVHLIISSISFLACVLLSWVAFVYLERPARRILTLPHKSGERRRPEKRALGREQHS